jgi:hypothetical protein
MDGGGGGYGAGLPQDSGGDSVEEAGACGQGEGGGWRAGEQGE